MKKWWFSKIAHFSHFFHREYDIFLCSDYELFWKRIRNFEYFWYFDVKFYFYELKWYFKINKNTLHLWENKTWKIIFCHISLFHHFKNHCPQKTTNTFTPPPKNGHFLGEGKLFFWERFNFELENFYSGETYFGASRVWSLAGWPISLIRPALLGHQFWFLPIWGIFIVIFLAQIWSYRTSTAKMTIPSGIQHFTSWNFFGKLNRPLTHPKKIYGQYNNIQKKF